MKWYIAYHSKSDRAIIILTGLNHEVFAKLLADFAPLFYSYSPYIEDGFFKQMDTTERRVQPRKITNHVCMALELMWTRMICQI